MSSRHLGLRGLSTFYADESDDKQTFVMAVVCIPTLTRLDDDALGIQHMRMDWDAYLNAAKQWRGKLKETFNVPRSKELKGSKIATGRNRYDGDKNPIYGYRAIQLYRFALESLAFLPDKSVFSVCAPRGYKIYGHTRLEAAMYVALQRMQRQMEAENRTALLFFDEGHAEYRDMYRRACVHLPTGSNMGAWASGAKTKNIPLTSVVKDANFKDSKKSYFVQIADLVAYATLLKARKEAGTLSEKEIRLGSGDLHDAIPRRILNDRVDGQTSDGIKRLKPNT
jgi:hypothetical protein